MYLDSFFQVLVSNPYRSLDIFVQNKYIYFEILLFYLHLLLQHLWMCLHRYRPPTNVSVDNKIKL